MVSIRLGIVFLYSIVSIYAGVRQKVRILKAFTGILTECVMSNDQRIRRII